MTEEVSTTPSKKQVIAAIESNDIDALRALIDAGYDDNAAEHGGGDFAIHVAARCGRAARPSAGNYCLMS